MKLWSHYDERNRLDELWATRVYGLTTEQIKYLRAFAADDGCFCCGKQNTNGRKLVIDHDHANGKVRGLLCHSCNVKLGKLRDNPPKDSIYATYLQSKRATRHCQGDVTARQAND
jgi:hypothetical protein